MWKTVGSKSIQFRHGGTDSSGQTSFKKQPALWTSIRMVHVEVSKNFMSFGSWSVELGNITETFINFLLATALNISEPCNHWHPKVSPLSLAISQWSRSRGLMNLCEQSLASLQLGRCCYPTLLGIQSCKLWWSLMYRPSHSKTTCTYFKCFAGLLYNYE